VRHGGVQKHGHDAAVQPVRIALERRAAVEFGRDASIGVPLETKGPAVRTTSNARRLMYSVHSGGCACDFAVQRFLLCGLHYPGPCCIKCAPAWGDCLPGHAHKIGLTIMSI
jgi:hypothetical protein